MKIEITFKNKTSTVEIPDELAKGVALILDSQTLGDESSESVLLMDVLGYSVDQYVQAGTKLWTLKCALKQIVKE